MKKPLYSKLVSSAEFQNKADAESFAKSQKAVYKQAEMSIKFDIVRTQNSGWRAEIYAKV